MSYDLEELRQEKRESDYQDYKEEMAMYRDFDYCVERICQNIEVEEAIDTLLEAVRAINNYDHEITIHELIDMF